MAALTSSSSAVRRTNLPAWLSVVLGLLAAAAIPAGIGASRYVPRLHLLDSVVGSVPAALVLGLLAILAARRARLALTLTLGRCGGARAARTGRALAFIGLYLACTGGIALGFYALLDAYS